MARIRWTSDDLAPVAGLACIFAVVGGVLGLLRGDTIIIGAIAGLILFGVIVGVGTAIGR